MADDTASRPGSSTPANAARDDAARGLGRRAALGLPLALAAPALPKLALAQAGGRPITLVVPYAPGGASDPVARDFAALFSQELGGQTIVIENRGGAAGHVGAMAVAQARPDGQTLLFAVNTNIVVNPHLQRGDRVDLVAALTPVAQLATYQYVLVVPPELGVSTLAELVALAKSRPPGSLTYASSGVGSNNHLAAVLFAEAIKVPMEHAAYRGTGPSLLDTIAGRVELNVSSVTPALPLVREGRLRALAVTGAKRLPQLPDVPTFREAGMPAITIDAWNGIFAPTGTPPDALDRYEAAAKRAMGQQRFVERMRLEGMEVVGERPRASFAADIREESGFWKQKIQELGITLE
jgi:tripartite-type tricarboxylate transporter receptor subunit TctC